MNFHKQLRNRFQNPSMLSKNARYTASLQTEMFSKAVKPSNRMISQISGHTPQGGNLLATSCSLMLGLLNSSIRIPQEPIMNKKRSFLLRLCKKAIYILVEVPTTKTRYRPLQGNRVRLIPLLIMNCLKTSHLLQIKTCLNYAHIIKIVWW